MTRDEIVKALRCFASEDNCPFDECNEKCPYWMEIDKYDIDNPNAEISDVHQLCRAAADMLEQADHFADTGKMVPLTLTAPEMSIDEVIDWLHAIAQQTQALATLDGKAAKIDDICLLAAELLSGFAAAEGHNRKDVSEICELQDRCENLTLYLDEIFRVHPSWKWVLDKYHPGLPGYVEKSSGLEARRNEES